MAISSYGLFGAIYEVTFRVRQSQALVVSHKTYTVESFERALPSLRAENKSMMYYLFPHEDCLTLESRNYEPAVSRSFSRLVWLVRNAVWKTGAAFVGKASGRVMPLRYLRYMMVDGFNKIIRLVAVHLLRSKTTNATDQIIRYPEKKNFSTYTFSIWAFPEDKIMFVMQEYFRFCKEYYEEQGYRCDLMNVGYRILEDQKSLFSYSYRGTVMTLDPVSSGGKGWDDFLKAYNEFCSSHDGVPLFNQSKWLTRGQVRRAFGDRIEKFWNFRQDIDPNGRFLNRYFDELFNPDMD